MAVRAEVNAQFGVIVVRGAAQTELGIQALAVRLGAYFNPVVLK